MTNAGDKSRVVAALDYLRSHHQFFEFDDQERVVKVGVSDAANVDELAAHVGNLRDLEKLRFSETDLTDVGLCHLAALVRLRELCIDGSKITSAGLTHLGAMSQLEYLYTKNARGLDMAAFTCLASLRSLRKLTLCGGRFSDADLAPLAALVNLEELTLSECNQLHGTFCKDLIGLPRLRRLLLGEIGGQVTDEGLASIAELSGLLALGTEGPFTNAGLRRLIELKNLTSLSIRSEHVTADGVAIVAELPKLDHLYLDTPHLADDGIPALLACSMLERTVFTRSALSDAGLQRLRDGLPKCGVEDLQRDPYEFGPQVDMKETDRPRFEHTTPFLTLLAEASDFDLVNGTFVKIGAHYGHWVDATQYSPEERVIMLVWHSSGIIDNGGFEYLFAGDFPGDPDYRITAEAYKTAGLLRGYEAFQEAFALFPEWTVPHDRAERSQFFHAANRSARDRLNRKLWQDGYEGSREQKLAEFIRKSAARLGNLDKTS
ncbi:MAG TPA: DUF4375 domain-containing protein [Pirellulales bacterium]|nr:DUF4375 domain-containing protein [Pirellulales bacterium]